MLRRCTLANVFLLIRTFSEELDCGLLTGWMVVSENCCLRRWWFCNSFQMIIPTTINQILDGHILTTFAKIKAADQTAPTAQIRANVAARIFNSGRLESFICSTSEGTYASMQTTTYATTMPSDVIFWYAEVKFSSLSDKSRFCLHASDDHFRVQCKPRDRELPECICSQYTLNSWHHKLQYSLACGGKI